MWIGKEVAKRINWTSEIRKNYPDFNKINVNSSDKSKFIKMLKIGAVNVFANK